MFHLKKDLGGHNSLYIFAGGWKKNLIWPKGSSKVSGRSDTGVTSPTQGQAVEVALPTSSRAIIFREVSEPAGAPGRQRPGPLCFVSHANQEGTTVAQGS